MASSRLGSDARRGGAVPRCRQPTDPDCRRPSNLERRRSLMGVRLKLDPRPIARIGAIFAVATALTIFLAAFVIGGSAPVDPNMSAVDIVQGAAGSHDANQVRTGVDDLG